MAGAGEIDIDEKNRTVSAFPDGLTWLDKPYSEVGAGIENIFRLFRIDAMWRLSYLDHPDISPFGIRLSVKLSF